MTAERNRTGALSPQERDVVARREAGQSATRIADEMGFRSRKVVYTVLSRARRKGVVPKPHPELERTSRLCEGRKKPNAGRAARVCLRCRHPFMSEGPHIRMCDDCKGFARGLSAQFIGA